MNTDRHMCHRSRYCGTYASMSGLPSARLLVCLSHLFPLPGWTEGSVLCPVCPIIPSVLFVPLSWLTQMPFAPSQDIYLRFYLLGADGMDDVLDQTRYISSFPGDSCDIPSSPCALFPLVPFLNCQFSLLDRPFCLVRLVSPSVPFNTFYPVALLTPPCVPFVSPPLRFVCLSCSMFSRPLKNRSVDFWQCTRLFPLFGPFDAYRHHS